VARKFYRIVHSAVPTVDDFRTAAEEGMPLTNEAHRREWAEGISVYDDLEYTLERARKTRGRLGAFVATVVIPGTGGVEVAKTMKNRQHYTIYASAGEILALVEGEAIKAEDIDDN
jgi:hypothetical protein